jgi:hypothetical protein|tara:strand:- start:1109 stop:1471 length:363 start_codon:yes stop_codon:yes gene_type:complete
MERFLILTVVFFIYNSFFSQKEITSKFVDNKELVDFLSKKKNINYLKKYGYYFLDLPKEKSFSDRLAGTILISDTSKLDINKIDIDFLMNDYQYYLVSNWNILLVLKSVEHLINEMKSVE